MHASVPINERTYAHPRTLRGLLHWHNPKTRQTETHVLWTMTTLLFVFFLLKRVDSQRRKKQTMSDSAIVVESSTSCDRTPQTHTHTRQQYKINPEQTKQSLSAIRIVSWYNGGEAFSYTRACATCSSVVWPYFSRGEIVITDVRPMAQLPTHAVLTKQSHDTAPECKCKCVYYS